MAMARSRRVAVSDDRGADDIAVKGAGLPLPHMVDHGWRKVAQAAGSQPTGPGEAPGGGGHKGAE